MFQRQHQRKPGKVDIKNAPAEIQQCYKDYMVLKKEMSAETGGVDVFGAHLNKPKVSEVIEKAEKRENLVAATPNLRKKFDIKKSKHKQVAESAVETSLINSFGLDSFVSETTSAPILPIKTNSFFAKNSSDILKNLEKQASDLSFHEVRSKRLLQSPEKENIDHQNQDVSEHQNPSPDLKIRPSDKVGGPASDVNNTKVKDKSFDVFELSEDNLHDRPTTKPKSVPSSERIERQSDPPAPVDSVLSINEDLLNQEQVGNGSF